MVEDAKNVDDLYMHIPRNERLRLRHLARVLGNTSERATRKSVVENWLASQRAYEEHKSEK